MSKTDNHNLLKWGSVGTIGLVFFGIFIMLAFLKYVFGQYNGIDLAIFNQVMWNTANGAPFTFTIHPQSYLGDHVALTLPILQAVYAWSKTPITLITLQGIALASTLIPLTLLLTHHGGKNVRTAVFSAILALFWLVNPFILAGGLFEFHVLTVAAPIFAWSYYFYRVEKYWPFLFLFAILLLTREDVALTLFMFVPIAWIERRPLKWWLPIGAASVGWFFIAQKISSVFSPVGSYKFLTFYSWMGETPLEILRYIFSHPLEIISKLFREEQREMLRIAFTSTGLFAILSPIALLFLIPSFLVHNLSEPTGTSLFLHLHYSTFFLVAIFLAITEFLGKLSGKLIGSKGIYTVFATSALLFVLVASAAASMHLSPINARPTSNLSTYRMPQNTPSIRATVLSYIDEDDSVAASTSYLSDISSREEAYSIHYLYAGVQQFSDIPFPMPELDGMILDSHNILEILVAKNVQSWASESIETGGPAFLKYIQEQDLKAAFYHDGILVLTKKGNLQLPYIVRSVKFQDKPSFENAKLSHCKEFLCLNTNIASPVYNKNLLTTLIIRNNDGVVWKANYLPAYGLLLPQHFDETKKIDTSYRLALPWLPDGTYSASIELTPIEGNTAFSTNMTIVYVPEKNKTLLDNVDLGSITVLDGTYVLEGEEPILGIPGSF